MVYDLAKNQSRLKSIKIQLKIAEIQELQP